MKTGSVIAFAHSLLGRAGRLPTLSRGVCVCVEKYRWMLAGAKILVFFFVERREMVFMRNVRM